MSRKKARVVRVRRKKDARKLLDLQKAADARAAEALRVVTGRAVWRLNVMEYMMLGLAGALALVAGAVSALGLQAWAGLPFRPSWVVASLLFFVIPGVLVLGRERRARRANRINAAGSSVKETDG